MTLDLDAIRSVIADELSRALSTRQIVSDPAQGGSASDDLEARYGAKLDRMMDNLGRNTD